MGRYAAPAARCLFRRAAVVRALRDFQIILTVLPRRSFEERARLAMRITAPLLQACVHLLPRTLVGSDGAPLFWDTTRESQPVIASNFHQLNTDSPSKKYASTGVDVTI